MPKTFIYYENEPILGVNISYIDDCSELVRDYFSSLYLFKAWAALEMPTAELIEVTDANYKHLSEKGLL